MGICNDIHKGTTCWEEGKLFLGNNMHALTSLFLGRLDWIVMQTTENPQLGHMLCVCSPMVTGCLAQIPPKQLYLIHLNEQ